LRPGETKASDPPLLMQAGMLGVAALCILIGVYPPLLYAILPYPTTYLAYDPVHVVSALLVLGAAAAFFFTVGRKILEPHDTQLNDFDVVYVNASRGICAFARVLQEVFIIIYDFAKDASRLVFSAGTLAMGMENRDVNWNLAIFGSVLVAIMGIVLLGVFL